MIPISNKKPLCSFQKLIPAQNIHKIISPILTNGPARFTHEWRYEWAGPVQHVGWPSIQRIGAWAYRNIQYFRPCLGLGIFPWANLGLMNGPDQYSTWAGPVSSGLVHGLIGIYNTLGRAWA